VVSLKFDEEQLQILRFAQDDKFFFGVEKAPIFMRMRGLLGHESFP
jgi:hypothetical protein